MLQRGSKGFRVVSPTGRTFPGSALLLKDTLVGSNLWLQSYRTVANPPDCYKDENKEEKEKKKEKEK